MPPLSPVVCALDLHAESEAALTAAAAWAARAGGPLHLVTVRPPDGPDAYRPPGSADAGVEAVVEVYVDRALGTGACAEMRPEIVVAHEDDPASALVRYAERVGAGVLVLGTHGRRGVQRLRLGSVAEAAIRRSPCPVLVVPNRSEGVGPGPAHPVLVAVDFSAPSAAALADAAALARRTHAPLHAAHVVSAVGVAPPFLLAVTPPLDPAVPDPAQMEAALHAFAAHAGAPSDAVHVVNGPPPVEIAALAERLDAGCVVMGTRGLGRALWGSVTEAVLRRLGRPVLAVHGRIEME